MDIIEITIRAETRTVRGITRVITETQHIDMKRYNQLQ